MTKFLAFLVLTLSVSGCTTLSSLADGVTLSVGSYDKAGGDYTLVLRNNTSRAILYVNPYQAFHIIRSTNPAPYPAAVEDIGLMINDTKLGAFQSVTLSGKGTATGMCSRPATYVSVLSCWFTKAWTCPSGRKLR